MSLIDLPAPLNKVFANTKNLPLFFDRLTIAIVELLKCDRCQIYLRDPQFHTCQIIHCYCVRPEIPNTAEKQKRTESYYLPQQDPFFAAALNREPFIFIEDMTRIKIDFSTGTSTNRAEDVTYNLPLKQGDRHYWQQNYLGQKALVQAHIILGQDLWGIVQAAQFNYPRPWTKFDRSSIVQIVDNITPLVSVYARKELRGTIQVFHDGNC